MNADFFKKPSASICIYLRLIFLILLFCCKTVFAQGDVPEILTETVRRGSVEQKRDALFQIRNLETPEASRAAIPALTDKSEIVRATAAFSVVFLPKDEAVTVLLPLLADKKELVRREAAYALGKTRNPNAVNALLEVLRKDKILEVRAASVVALGKIGDVAAVSELVKILQRKPKTEEEFLRRSAARSIGQIAQIIQTGNREVQTPEDFLPDNFTRIEQPKRPNLLETFPAFRVAGNRLMEMLQNKNEADDVRRETAFALGAIGDNAAISALKANLAAEDYYLAKISAEALLKISAAENR